VIFRGKTRHLSVLAGQARDAEAFDSGRRAGRGMPFEHAQALVE
jgi:hypothetical protein